MSDLIDFIDILGINEASKEEKETKQQQQQWSKVNAQDRKKRDLLKIDLFCKYCSCYKTIESKSDRPDDVQDK